jgi:hypothetical protein
MNCEAFEHVVSDLARGQVLEARARDGALDHVAVCNCCRVRLGDERRLSSDLRVLAEMMKPFEARAEVETRVLEAFRSRLEDERRLSGDLRVLAQAMKPLKARSEVEARVLEAFRGRRSVASFPLQAGRRKHLAAMVAAAAVVWLVVGLTGLQWAYRFSTRENTAQTPREKTETPLPKSNEQDSSPQSLPKNRPLRNSVANKSRAVPPSAAPIQPTRGREQKSASNSGNRKTEIATDFFPIGDTSALSLADGGQLVRVQLPRSTLMKFGLPVNVDRANERMKADVLLGSDGIARAIRFVR